MPVSRVISTSRHCAILVVTSQRTQQRPFIACSMVNGRLDYCNSCVTPYIVFQHQQVTAGTKLCCPYHHKTTAIGPHYTCSRRSSLATSSVPHPILACNFNIQGADHSGTYLLASSGSISRQLQSDGRYLLHMDRIKCAIAERAFYYLTPAVCNGLPPHLIAILFYLPTFEQLLKTELDIHLPDSAAMHCHHS